MTIHCVYIIIIFSKEGIDNVSKTACTSMLKGVVSSQSTGHGIGVLVFDELSDCK